ncbi:unnamed protein product [Orchesella dallaii]|uniref:Integrin beta subunit VWA domain-containing protein n=1 Tax=Orchesella dallaii TaxID=48710 RepID=A0ABP1RQH1_9HEXA
MFSAKKLRPLIIIGVLIVLLELAQNGHGQYCSAKTKLQVAFVQDRTYTFSPFISEFSKAVLKIMGSFHRDTPDAEFAHAAFADYEVSLKRAYPYTDPNPVNAVTSCYELIQNLTNDRELFHDKVTEFSKTKWVNGAYDPPESSMTAILYTITDIWMGAPPAGPDVKKIVILITDEEPSGAKDAAYLTFKPKPKGKGDCLNYGYPSLRTVGEIMRRENIYIIGLLAPTRRTAEEHAKGYPDIDIKAVWTDIFTELGVPFYVEMMPDASMAADSIVKVVRNSISRMACAVPPATAPPAPASPPVAPPPTADDGDKIQIVFVFDRTQEFSSFLQEFASKAENVVRIFQKMFSHVEYGITAFADFPLHIKKGGEPQAVTLGLNIDDSSRCYDNILPLTKDGDLFLETLQQFVATKWVNGFDPPESSMTALLYTAADKEINWHSSHKTTKIIILITDEDTVGTKDAPELVSKPKPKGDGLDTCTDHSYPDIETVRTVFQQNNLKLIGLFPRNLDRMKGSPKINTKLLWEKYFTEIGVKYHIRRLKSVLDMGKVGIKIIQGVKVMRNMSIPDDKDSAEDEGDAVGEIKDASKKDKMKEKDHKGIIKPTKLQIAFVIERKSTFHAFNKSFVKKSTEMMDGIRKLTANSTFNETEFGFAAFDDFDLPIKQGVH